MTLCAFPLNSRRKVFSMEALNNLHFYENGFFVPRSETKSTENFFEIKLSCIILNLHQRHFLILSELFGKLEKN